jgi:secreted Zn-dependent insulinase-like peptidase
MRIPSRVRAMAFRDCWYSANLMKAVIYSNKPLPELARMAADTFGRGLPGLSLSVSRLPPEKWAAG